jgi:cyclic beta-1,2-glucan synthetase
MAAEHCRNADTLPGLADCLKALARLAGDLHAAAHRAAPDDAAGLRAWTAKLASQCDAAYADLLHMAPWMRAMHEFVIDASLTRIPTLRALAAYGMTAPDDDAEAEADHHSRQLLLARLVAQGSANARARLEDIAQLAQMARACAAMDFTLLYDADAARLASGYHVAEERLAAAAANGWRPRRASPASSASPAASCRRRTGGRWAVNGVGCRVA